MAKITVDNSALLALESKLSRLDDEEKGILERIKYWKTYMEGPEYARKLRNAEIEIEAFYPKVQLALQDTMKLESSIESSRASASAVIERVKKIDDKRRSLTASIKILEQKISLKRCEDDIVRLTDDVKYLDASKQLVKWLHLAGRTNNFLSFDELYQVLEGVPFKGCVATIHKYCIDLEKRMDVRDKAGIELCCALYSNLGLKEKAMDKFIEVLQLELESAFKEDIKAFDASSITTLDDTEIEKDTVFSDILAKALKRVSDTINESQKLLESSFDNSIYSHTRLLSAMKQQAEVQVSKVVALFLQKRDMKQKAKRVLLKSSDSEALIVAYLADKQVNKLSQSSTTINNLLSKTIKRQSSAEQLIKEVDVLSSLAEALEIESENSLIALDNLCDRVVLLTQHVSNFKEFLQLKQDMIAALGDVQQANVGASFANEDVQDLISIYGLLEGGYLKFALFKAFDIDSIDLEGSVRISSVVSDTFFIFEKCLQRSINTGNVDCVCMILNNIVTVQSDIIDKLYTKKMAAIEGPLNSMLPQQLSDKEAIYSFLIELLNTLQRFDELTGDLGTYLQSMSNEKFGLAAEKLNLGISEYRSATLCVKSIIEQGLSLVMTDLFAELRSQIASTYSSADISFELTEEEFKFLQENEPNLIPLTDMLTRFFLLKKEQLLLELYLMLVLKVADYIAKILLIAMKSRSFTILGAMIFQHDVKKLLSFFENLLGAEQKLRLKELHSIFKKLLETCDVLTIYDRTDIVSFQLETLSSEEVKALFRCRKDLA